MTPLRHHLMQHRALAAWLVAFALLMRVLVPGGYMIGVSPAGVMTIEPCRGYGPVKVAAPRHGMAHHQGMREPRGQEHQGQEHRGKEMPPCGFSGLSAPLLIDAPPLALAPGIAFVPAVSRIVTRSTVPDTPPHLRPPLRGPPASA